MANRVKYSIKQKASTVQSILAGRLSYRGAARELGCDNRCIRKWVEQYKQHGVKGFKFRNGRYDEQFKLKVVRYYFKKGLPLNEIASYFKIPSESVVRKWVRDYERLGALGLMKKPKGRPKSIMTKKSKKKEIISSDPATQKLAEMQKELDYLRAENAFLKKLRALVQQEEAAKAQARRPKSSGN